ncbi:MAG: hypothetical protein RL757_3275 [Bacteroidota bacterium]
MKYQLAQINIAKLLAPIDSPLLADFVADLDRINGIAEQSAGFVWRLQGDSGNATGINPYDNAAFIVNVSVWKDVESLKNFVYRSGHLDVFLKRAHWFEPMKTPHMALWWIAENDFPTPEACKIRLDYLTQNGESEFAFSFRNIFEPKQS